MTDATAFRGQLFDRLAAAGEAGRLVAESLEPGQADQLATYYRLLQHWNRRINLTALPLEHFPAPTLDRLIVEPLLAASAVRAFRVASNWIDLGSGGGSPAIPIKIADRAVPLTMVESRSRKVAFLRTAAGELRLINVTAVAARVEELPSSLRGRFDLATVRAVRIDEAFGDAVGKLLGEGGLLVQLSAIGSIPRVSGFRVVERAEFVSTGTSVTVFAR